MSRKASWEIELWYYVTGRDMVGCPRYINCEKRETTGICGCPVFGNTPLDQTDCKFCEINTSLFMYKKLQNLNDMFIEVVRPGRLKELTEMLAMKWLRQYRVARPPVPTELFHTVEHKARIDIHTIPLKSCHGALWKASYGWVIFLNSTDGNLEHRMTLFHEAFHIMANRNRPPNMEKREPWDITINEILAETFARQILMPSRWIETEWCQTHEIGALVNKFRVPRRAVEQRLRDLKLLE